MNGAAGLMMKARGPKHENNNRNFLLLIVAHPFHLLAATRKCSWILHELVMRRQRWHFAYNCRCLRADATAHALIALNKKSIPAILVGLHTHKFFDISDVTIVKHLGRPTKAGSQESLKIDKKPQKGNQKPQQPKVGRASRLIFLVDIKC
jgi:hypothetical protein